MMNRLSVKLLSATAALFFGSGLTSVYALTETDFTNTGIVLSAPTQYENNDNNNNSVVLVQPKGLTVEKVADASTMSTPTQLGDVISYTITLDNIGLLGLTGITLADSIIPAANLTLSAGDSNSDSVLDADEVWVYNGSYAVTQSDIDSFGGGDGDIDNTVTVSSNELDPITDDAEVPITQAPAFTVVKTVDKPSISAPGTLTYSIAVKNTGNQTLTGISLNDALPDASVGSPTGPNADTGISGALDVGETWTYIVSYNATQIDIDSGAPLVNTVSVTTTETGADIQSDNAQTTIAKAPAMVVKKDVDILDINAPATLGYIIVVENTGNVTLNNVTPVDTLPDGSNGVLAGPLNDSGIAGALDVGESWTYNVSYNAPQGDIDAALDLVNTIIVTSDETGTDPVTDTASTTIKTAPSMTVSKAVDIASINSPSTLNYSIFIENTGNVSLSNVAPVDTLPDGTTATLVGPLTDTGLAGQLDVGEIWEYTTSYAVSQSEIDLGLARTNTVDVTSTETGGDVFSDTAQTTIARSPAFTLAKSVDAASITEPGVLNYQIVINNTGNTSLTDIQLSDTLPNATSAILTGPVADIGASGVMDVGESWTYIGQYTATQADIDSGTALTNSVTVSTAEAGSQDDTAVTSVSQAPGIDIAKANTETEFTALGDTVNYTLTVTNTGNVVLSNIVVSDPIADASSLTCALPMPFVLQPGAQTTCTATRSAAVIDISATQIVNQASVSSDDPAGNNVSSVSNTVIVQMLRIPPLATDDDFQSPVGAVPITLEGATDDMDTNADLDPTSVNLTGAGATDLDGDGDNDTLVVAGEGTWLVDDATGQVTFTPLPGFTADPTPTTYTVSDATDLVSNEALLSIDYPQSAPVAEDDYKQNTQVESPTNPTTLNVLADNGSGVDSDPENDIDVQSVNFVSAAAVDSDDDGDNDTLVVAGEGTWVIDNASANVTFTPEAGFLSDPTPVFYTISDINGLVSNEALITIDYPQTAPVANDDEKLNQPLGQPATVATVVNDEDPENNLDPTTVMLLDPDTANRVTTLTIPGEGVWTVDPATGDITFTPEPGYVEDPAPVQYTVSDTTGLESNIASVIVSYEEPAALEGIVWLDADRDGQVGADEERKAGWTLKVYDDNGTLVATTMTDADGYYLVEGLIPGVFTVEFFNENGVFMDIQTTDGIVSAGEMVNLPLPVDPGGVVYDSITREAVAGVTLNMVNVKGDLLHPDCLYANQQSQVTTDDGLYAFNLNPGAHNTCPSEGIYRIQIANAPTAYHPNFSAIIRQEGAASCGDVTLGCAVSRTFESDVNETNCTIDSHPGTNACEVQFQPDAPDEKQQTQYFVEFYIQSGDRNVIFNHLPIDARANDAQILLSKTADKRAVSVGSFVEYTLTAENTKEVPAVDIAIVDDPPSNFSLVASSIRMIQAGVDGEFDTADDAVQTLNPSDLNPILLNGIDFEPLETIRFKYVMRVGVGVVAGSYANKATASGLGGVASNTVSATVEIIPDPVLEQATLVGKVFNDRDADGAQDPAGATGVALRSDHYGWNSLNLPPLPGRDSVNDDPAEHAAIVNMPISDNNRFMVVTREGTRISVDHEGTISEAHVGAKARGMNAQDIRVCTQYTRAIPTNQQGTSTGDGVESDVLQIVIQNYGVNEEGIPGVRLATVTGLLIETDAYGRYSIPDVDAGTTGIGQNFVLKVDPATLPQGSRFTTENPYVLRIVNASLNKINFGVLVPDDDPYLEVDSQLCIQDENEQVYQSVEVSLGSVFFDTDKHNVREDQRGIVLDIVNKLREYGGGQILIEAHTDSRASKEYNLKLAERRAETIRNILSESLGSEMMELISVDVNPAAYTEQEQ